LTKLHIKNYALIEDLKVDFKSGLTTITGETGAGKSILLGGLSLVLGKRIDLSNIKDPTKKSIIECIFDIDFYSLQPFFDKYDLEYDSETIIRREILPSGKSRAFVNDSPVKLTILSELGSLLIDIHSQNQTLSIITDSYQFDIVDALAKTKSNLNNYSSYLSNHKTLKKNIENLKLEKQSSINEFDYHSFLLNELIDSNVLDIDFELLESEYNSLSNVDLIQTELSQVKQIFDNNEIGLNVQLIELKRRIAKLCNIASEYLPISERVESISIELDDIFSEIEFKLDNLESNPSRLNEVESQLKLIHNLFTKHNVGSIEDLNIVFKVLKEKTSIISGFDKRLDELNTFLDQNLVKLNNASSEISKKRLSILPNLESELDSLLHTLGMPHAKFKIKITPSADFLNNGKDLLSFELKSNKGGSFLPLKKGASGGELSRIMLAVKYILSKHQQLPTIMFDEIDTGVSGEISNKIASIMQEMSNYMQVFTITHLPQIAAKGDYHFKVFKTENDTTTITQLKLLDNEERVKEIAQMLDGKQISQSARAHAKQLLN
jgi:DNA repair protein RecN (Recombination protein N)